MASEERQAQPGSGNPEATLPSVVRRYLQLVDGLNELMGNIGAWVFIPLILLVVLDVVLRYVFRSPTIWAWDVNVQLMGVIVVLGGGYTLLNRGHVAVDILTSKLSRKKKAVIDALTSSVAVVALALLFWRIAIQTAFAVSIQERFSSTWYPPIYPLKVLIAVGVGAFLLQAIATTIRNLAVLSTEGRR